MLDLIKELSEEIQQLDGKIRRAGCFGFFYHSKHALKNEKKEVLASLVAEIKRDNNLSIQQLQNLINSKIQTSRVTQGITSRAKKIFNEILHPPQVGIDRMKIS